MPTVTPPPPPELIVIATTPGTRPLHPALQVCAQEFAGVSLAVSETPATRLDPEAVDLAIRIGSPDDAPAFQAALASDRLDVVIHPDNPIHSISAADLAALYRGEVRRWSNLKGLEGEVFTEPLTVWTYPPGDDLRLRFESVLPTRLRAWEATATVAPDPEAMRQALSEDPGSIGYLPGSWDHTGVNVLPVEPGAGATWEVPVMALTGVQPAGTLFDLLACLQSGAGHDTLRDAYPDS